MTLDLLQYVSIRINSAKPSIQKGETSNSTNENLKVIKDQIKAEYRENKFRKEAESKNMFEI